MRNDFAIFILTHGRANNQKTLNTLKSHNYDGEYFLVLDDQDTQIQEYINNYGSNHVIVFNKNYYINTIDTGLRTPVAKFAVYARCAIEDIAKSLCYKYFLMLDDDITGFRFRYDCNGSLKTLRVFDNFNDILLSCINYVESANIACLTYGVCNIYRSGVKVVHDWHNRYRIGVNCFLRNAKFEVNWRLNMQEDLITCLDCTIEGQVWLTLTPMQIDIGFFNGKVSGGNTDTYKSVDGFTISFLPVLVRPYCNQVAYYKDHWKPLTHTVLAINNIISCKYKKGKKYAKTI